MAVPIRSGLGIATSLKNNENVSLVSTTQEHTKKVAMMNEVASGNELKSKTERNAVPNSSGSTTAPATSSTSACHTNEEKRKKKTLSKKGRPSKAQMKQSSLEATDASLERESSWKKKISERTARSRSLEEDYGDNSITNNIAPVPKTADVNLIEDRLFLGNGNENFPETKPRKVISISERK